MFISLSSQSKSAPFPKDNRFASAGKGYSFAPHTRATTVAKPAHIKAIFVLILCLLIVPDLRAQATATTPVSSAENLPEKSILVKFDKNHDWVVLKSGEVLKGKITNMYKNKLTFDSDILDELSIDWDDIKEIYAKDPMSMRLDNRTTIQGNISMSDNAVTVKEDSGDTTHYDKADVVSLATTHDNEWKNWTFDASFGANFQGGNSKQTSYSASATVKRETASTRFILNYMGLYSKNNDIVSENNQRLTGSFDYYFDKRIFFRSIQLQYYYDPFQNINFQGIAGTGVGYQILDTNKIEWDIIGGPAYQYTEYDTVPVGEKKNASSPAAFLSTTYSIELTKRIDLEGNYQVTMSKKNAGLINAHLVTTLSYEINDIFDIRMSLVWNYVMYPAKTSSGSTPKPSDLNLILGIGVSY